jgi:rhamnosyltransferase
VSTVFVIDNASRPEGKAVLERLCAELGVVLIANEENVGVAGAYNQVASIERGQGYAWMLLLDQDTVAPVGLVQQLMRGVERWRGTRLPAVASPLSVGSDPSIRQSAVVDADMAVKSCMSAGSVVNLTAWEAVGGYNSDFFVDYVDHDFCFKCRHHGWDIIQVAGAVIVHIAGSPTRHRLLWRRPVISNHSAIRRYYIARNRVLFYRQYWRLDTRWVLGDVYNAVKEVMLIVLFESGKWEKLVAIVVGTSDGLRGLSGKTQRKRFMSEK